MPRPSERLTARTVTTLKRKGLYPDGKGLWLQISKSGSKSWVFRFQLQKRPRSMGLGSAAVVSLAEARQKAQDARKLLDSGIDPIEERERQRAAAEQDVTFKAAAEQFITDHAPTWKNAKHRAQWESTLTAHVYDHIGGLSVKAITLAHVVHVLRPIWSTLPETAGRVRGRIEAVLDSALPEGMTNPATKTQVAKRLPTIKRAGRIQHHPALPFQQIGAFMADLRAEKGIAPRALEFTILTAARTGEAIGAKWSEIDTDAKLWTVPAERMKGKREHIVPLSDRALEILEEMRPLQEPMESFDIDDDANGNAPKVHRGKPGEYVFPGRSAAAPLSDMALLAVLRRMGLTDIVTHGFRSTFRDWVSETTPYPGDVAEMALAHAIRDKTEASYRHGKLLEKRRSLMADWAKFCTLPPAAGNVVPIKAKG